MLNVIDWPKLSEKLAVIMMALSAFYVSILTSPMTIFFFASVIFYWISGNWQEKWEKVKKNPISYWILALAFILIMGSLYSKASVHDIVQNIYKYSKLFFLPFLIPFFANKKNQTIVLYAFIAGAIFMVVMSYFKVWGFPIMNHSVDPNCAFHDHIQTSFEVAITMFILAHKLLDESSIALKVFFAVTIILFGYYLFVYNDGRSGLVLFAILFIIFFLQRFAFDLVVFSAFMLCLLFGFFFHYSQNLKVDSKAAIHNIANYINHNDVSYYTSEGKRLAFWTNSLALIKQHPILGTGTGSYTTEFSKRAFAKTVYDDIKNNPHNEYLLFGVQFGVIGITFLISWFFFLLFLARKIDPKLKFIAQGIIISYTIGCLFNSWLLDNVHGFIFIILVGLFYAELSGKMQTQILNKDSMQRIELYDSI